MDSKSSKDEPPDEHLILNTLKSIVETESNILREVRKSMTENVQDFVNKDISKLFQLAKVYSQSFQSLGVKTKDEFERLIKPYYRHHEDILEAFEDLHKNEREWDDILLDIDKGFQQDNDNIIKEGDQGPLDIPLVNCKTDEQVTLKQYLSSDTSSLLLILLRHFA